MFKLGESEPEILKPRTYRLRTNDEAYEILFQSPEVLDWEDMWNGSLQTQSQYSLDTIEEKVEAEEWIWTLEWGDIPEDDPSINVDFEFDIDDQDKPENDIDSLFE